MIARILMFLLIFSPVAATLQGTPLINRMQNALAPEPPPPAPVMKILLVNDHNGVVLEVKGKYKVYDARNMQLIGTRYLGKRKYLQGIHGGILWGEEFPGIHQIAIVPDDARTTINVDGVEYSGSIFAYDLGGTVSVVNHLDVERYLDSILPAEYEAPLPEELLNAIAIAARTNAYYQAQNSRSPYWDVEATKVGYHGAVLSKRASEITRAVRDTQFMVLNRVGKDGSDAAPFPANWRPLGSGPIVAKGEYSKITVQDASRLAESGLNAAQILEKAFPNSKIELMHYAPGK